MLGFGTFKKVPSTFKNNRKISRKNQINFWKKSWRAGVLRLVERILAGANVSDSLAGSSIQILHLPEVRKQIASIELIHNGKALDPINLTLAGGIPIRYADVHLPIYRLVVKNAKISMIDNSVWLNDTFTLDSLLPAWQRLMYAGGISDSLIRSKNNNPYFSGDWAFLGKSNYYYHQLAEELPSLLMSIQGNTNIKILVSVEAQPAIIQLLQLLPNKITLVSEKMVEVENLHAVTSGRTFSQIEGEVLREFAIKAGLINNKIIPRQKLFIARGELSRGSIEIENGILDSISDLGFTVINPENFEAQEQIKIFSNADTVISFHGGALANMIWLKPGSKVVELFNHEYRTYHFPRMARELGHNYIGIDFEDFSDAGQLSFERLVKKLRSTLD